MFNRRFIREKTVQAYYGYVQGGAESAVVCQKNLLAGLDQTAALYYLQIAFLISLSEYAEEKYQGAMERKRVPEKALEGLRLMARNIAIDHLKKDTNYLLNIDSYKFNWKDRQADLVSAVFAELFSLQDGNSVANTVLENLKAEKAEAVSPVSPEETAFEFHRAFLRKLYKRKIGLNPILRSYCEERSLFWESDYESAVFWVFSTISQMSPERNNNVDPGWSPNDEAVVFGKTLLEKTLLHQDEYNQYIYSRLQNWKPERLGVTERVLLCMAVSELVNFPSIPVKVTLNEYIELGKRFCLPESASFINGVLNKIVVDLQSEKKILKSGRGLIG